MSEPPQLVIPKYARRRMLQRDITIEDIRSASADYFVRRPGSSERGSILYHGPARGRELYFAVSDSNPYLVVTAYWKDQ